VDELFSVYDADKNEKLDIKEATSLIKDFLNHFNHHNKHPKNISNILDLLDVDHDQNISREELHHLLSNLE